MKPIMGSVLHSKFSAAFHNEKIEHVSLWKSFLNWAESQQEDRFLWMALGIVGHTTFITVVTILAITTSGNYFIYWPFTISAMMACLVVNVAGQPTKVTIPILFISLVIDLVIIVLCATHGLGISSGYQ